MRLLRPLLLPLSVLVLLTAAVRVPLPFYIERPGSLRSLAANVSVPDGGDLDGDFLLTTVNYRRGTVAEGVVALFDEASEVMPTESFIPEGVSTDEYFAGQRTVFDLTADVAAAVALEEAGYDVEDSAVTGEGALVVSVLSGSPAEGVLRSGDVVVRADGQPVTTGEELQQAVLSSADRPLDLVFRRDGERRSAELTPQPSPETGGPVIGVQIQTLEPRVNLPLSVEVDSGRIGGPSAGLLIALTVYDKLVDEVDLTGGRQVAGTGTLDSDGRVGPIGSIAQKVVTAARAEADVFLAPASQYEAARGAVPASSSLDVLGVASFEEAIEVLEDTRGAAAGRWPPARPLSMIGLPPWSAPGG